jgi:hypothetical protein
MTDTEAIWQHDSCPRFRTWGAKYELPRIPLAQAMHDALRAGLVAGDAARAKEVFLGIAAQPGLDIEAHNVYDIAVHHAALMEVVCAYLSAEGPWKPCGFVDDCLPKSFLMEDGRIRRVVLCSTWNPLREAEERTSWRTIADVCITGRPMLINAIVIGNSLKGFRPTPWTRAYEHPENSILRVQKKEGNFTANWKRIYRENTDQHAADWLRMMQEDGAFEELVFSVNVGVPENRKAILSDISRINKALVRNETEMRRSACYRYGPCSFARVCHHPRLYTPALAGWTEQVVTEPEEKRVRETALVI